MFDCAHDQPEFLFGTHLCLFHCVLTIFSGVSEIRGHRRKRKQENASMHAHRKIHAPVLQWCCPSANTRTRTLTLRYPHAHHMYTSRSRTAHISGSYRLMKLYSRPLRSQPALANVLTRRFFPHVQFEAISECPQVQRLSVQRPERQSRFN